MSLQGALSGIKVLDLSRILAGPWATQMLGDLGADVIKIEATQKGDDTRGWGPPYVGEDENAVAAYFCAANRNKRSLALDISQAKGQEIIKALASKADVLVENFKTGGLQKYGLDYSSLFALNPRLIYCSITGFGQSGPYKNRAGYDFMIQAIGGLMSVTGEPEGSPMKAGVALTDILTGLYAANAIQAALLYRQQSGLGQHIDLALLDVQVACLANQAMNYLASGKAPQRLGNAHPNIVPYQSFETMDGYIILAIGNDQQFARFCALAKQNELALDPRFATNAARVQNRQILVPLLEPILKQFSCAWWLQHLENEGVPCGPVNDIQQVFADPQVQFRQMQQAFNDSQGQSIPFVANPINFSASPVKYAKAPPQLGEHSQDILQEWLHLSSEEIQQLSLTGVVKATNIKE
ncbi:CaiB/BaiF CoA-transferase family protein [Aliiglaciecola sp. CAU 1673]|uniref:CaiB/BaiF CoA transferase family protein n=1 Tax=Aliiglaciecola sp. CAU 1673 TaxID=3032595 RepID=UPI0023DB8E01|nr:CaiB/BaiF CoA-transferase family protein [Aliiglaciecola sp. CAU 1673]MDF2178005.1 CaiB/BaiF CoA-transferase family protein [Aliiglaciecola sp. CAU 1673]